MGRYVRSGHVVFGRLDALMAVPFDLERLAVTGAAVRTGETVRIGSEGADYAVSDEGVLVHLPGDAHRMDTRLVWVDRDTLIARYGKDPAEGSPPADGGVSS